MYNIISLYSFYYKTILICNSLKSILSTNLSSKLVHISCSLRDQTMQNLKDKTINNVVFYLMDNLFQFTNVEFSQVFFSGLVLSKIENQSHLGLFSHIVKLNSLHEICEYEHGIHLIFQKKVSCFCGKFVVVCSDFHILS